MVLSPLAISASTSVWQVMVPLAGHGCNTKLLLIILNVFNIKMQSCKIPSTRAFMNLLARGLYKLAQGEGSLESSTLQDHPY